MTQNEQITELNEFVKTRLAPSTIHGIGVFALRDIKQGEKLFADLGPRFYDLKYANLGKLRTEVKALLLEQWPQIQNGSKFAYPTTRFQAFMNHCSVPNYDAVLDLALCDINAGEEITEDYRKIEGADKIFPFLSML